MDSEELKNKFPLLWDLLAQKGLALQGIYTIRDVARIFDVSVRTIQEWIRAGKLVPRDLPGRGRFLSEDLETFLRESQKRSHGNSRKLFD